MHFLISRLTACALIGPFHVCSAKLQIVILIVVHLVVCKQNAVRMFPVKIRYQLLALALLHPIAIKNLLIPIARPRILAHRIVSHHGPVLVLRAREHSLTISNGAVSITILLPLVAVDARFIHLEAHLCSVTRAQRLFVAFND